MMGLFEMLMGKEFWIGMLVGGCAVMIGRYFF